MLFYFLVVIIFVFGVFVWLKLQVNASDEMIRSQFKMHRDRQHAIKGEYHKIDPDQ